MKMRKASGQEGALARLRRLGSRLDRKLFGKLSQHGFGVDAVLLIAFISLILSVVAIAFTEGLKWIFRYVLIPQLKFAPLMIHIPGIAGQPFFEETKAVSPLVPADLPGVFSVSQVMGELYGKFQVVALVGFIVALIVIGLTYASEQFNFVSKGTAMQLLSESGLILIMLFLFPVIYNGAAVVLNGLNQYIILGVPGKSPDQVISDVAMAAATFGPAGWEVTIPGVNFVQIIFTIAQATATFAALFSLIVVGTMRLVMIGMLVGAFPLILILRLIPPIRNIAGQLQGALIGLLIGTVLVSIIFRVAWGIIGSKELNDVMMWVIGIGTLIGSSFLMFAFATGLGGFARMAQAGITGPVSGVIGGTLAAAGGLATGGALGLGVGGATTMGGLGKIGLGEAVTGTLRSGLSGAAAGVKAGGPLQALVAVPGATSETAYKAGGARLTKEARTTEGTPPFHKFLEDLSSGEFMKAVTPLRRNDLHWEQEMKAGEMIARELNEGRLDTGMLQRMFAVAKFHPENKRQLNYFTNVVKHSELERPQLENALKAAYAEIKSNPTLGEDYANVWLRSLHNRALGKPPFEPLGHGKVFGSPIIGTEGGA